MSEYIVDFGDTSSAFVGLAMAEARAHGAELREEIVRCMDCASFREKDWRCTSFQWHNCDESPDVESDGFCAWGERRSDD